PAALARVDDPDTSSRVYRQPPGNPRDGWPCPAALPQWRGRGLAFRQRSNAWWSLIEMVAGLHQRTIPLAVRCADGRGSEAQVADIGCLAALWVEVGQHLQSGLASAVLALQEIDGRRFQGDPVMANQGQSQ